MDQYTEQHLHAMYGTHYSPRNMSGSSARKSWETVELDRCDGLIAKYSKPAAGSAKATGNYNGSLMEATDGSEGIGFDRIARAIPDSQYDTCLDDAPDLKYALSVETAELIKKASSVKKDSSGLLSGNSFRGQTSSRNVKRLLSDAKKFEESLSLQPTLSLKSTQSHMTPPVSNRTMTMNSSHCRARRALEPPESYLAPQLSPKKMHSSISSRDHDVTGYKSKYSTTASRAHSVSSRDDFNTSRFTGNSSNSLKSARDLYTPTASPNSVHSFRDFSKSSNYSPNSVRFASDLARQPTDCSSSVKSFRSSSSGTANTGDVSYRFQDLNARSNCLKAYMEHERNAELAKSASAWSEIDSRLDYLKKRCSDLRQHTEITGNSDTIGSSAPSHFSTSIEQSRSDCGKSVSHSSVQSERNAKTDTSSRSVKPVALKVLSERVLSGYRITRENCEKCGVSKLAKCDRTPDGSASATDQPSECVFCPIDDMRSDIQSTVCRKILASKLLMGSPTFSRGKLCELCASPTLVQVDGTVICEVCPVLDAICLEVARDQTKGGRLMQLLPCNACGAKTVSLDGNIKCVACTIMKEWQQEQQQQKQKQKEEDEVKKLVQSPSATADNASTVSEIKKNPSTSTETVVIKTVQSINDAPMESSPGQNKGDGDDWTLAAVKSSEEAKKNGEKPKIFESLMGRCGVVSDGSPTKEVVLNISNLQGQLLHELAKARQCQLVLENSIQDPAVNNGDGTLSPSPEELKEELAKAKRCQYALERIIETTSNMEEGFPSILPNEADIDDMMSAPELKGSFSVSQQEVDAGQPKEYIPPPSFFRSGIPSMVEVTLITPAPDSNIAQAYETNLRNTDNDKKLVSKSRVGIDFWPFTRAGNDARRQEEEVQGGFDYDTIQTDDFTVDYTLNTKDDSRLEYLHIKSKNMTNKVRFQLDEEKELEAGCSFMDCFGCANDNVNEGRQDDINAHRARLEEEDIQRENPVPVSSLQDPPSEKNSAVSVASEVSSQVPSNKRPAWIGSGTAQNKDNQEPPAANDYSEISDVSGHIYRGIRRASTTRSPQMQNRASDYSAVSELSGSINRMHDYMHEITSVTSDNSGSMVQLSGRRNSGSTWRPGRGSGKAPSFQKMSALLEAESIDASVDKYLCNRSTSGSMSGDLDKSLRNSGSSRRPGLGSGKVPSFQKTSALFEAESIDTSIDKYMFNHSTSGSMSGDLAEMRRIVNGFERSNPASMKM